MVNVNHVHVAYLVFITESIDTKKTLHSSYFPLVTYRLAKEVSCLQVN